jgi:hypothetical protein
MDGRFDALETKLDNHLERISKTEVAIEWLRGHVRLVTTIGITIVGFLLAHYFNTIIGG